MNIVKKYIKYGMIMLCGFIISSVVVVVNADDILLSAAENDHEEATELLTKHGDYLDKFTSERDEKIARITEEYAPLLEEQEKFIAQAETLICKTESRLAKAKMQAFLKKEIELTEEDTKRLSPKMLWECEEEEVVVEGEEIDRIAYAVAMAETHNCTKGYGEEYNNCFGMKNGSIAPCEEIGRNRMCIYESTEDSYAAFKKVWVEGYGGGYPTTNMAAVWTGNDRPGNWLNNFADAYNKYPNI
jgi:hypothetical protein